MHRLLFILLLSLPLYGRIGIVEELPLYQFDDSHFIPSIRYRGGNGRDWRHGYETAELFLAYTRYLECGYPFVDLRLHRLHSGEAAANLGWGARYLLCPDEMLGLNFFYDYRRFNYADLQQFGIGGEIFLRDWELRINGYIPFGHKNVLHDVTIFNFAGGFVAKRNRFNRAVWAVDVDFGRSFVLSRCAILYLGAGPYFFGSKNIAGAVGGMLRANLNFYKYFSIGLYYTNDRSFKSRFQGEIEFSIPFGCCCSCIQSLFLPIFRNDIIITRQFCKFKNNF